MIPELLRPFFSWSLSWLVMLCAEPSALVCLLPARSPSQPLRWVSRLASPRPGALVAHRRFPTRAQPEVGK
jgi:hypothetical protein